VKMPTLKGSNVYIARTAVETWCQSEY